MSTEPIQDKPPSPKAPAKTEDFFTEVLKTVGVAILLALGMRQFVAEARFIPSGSMEPTLQVDDRLIIDKVSYRFNNPHRGDIVVFDPTQNLQELGYNEAFIKRIIGLPGDKVEVVDDKVKINGAPLSENYPSGVHIPEMTKMYEAKHQQDPNKYPLWNKDARGIDWQGTVPEGQYLVLGDHRSGSLDSRSWGFVPRDKIVGKATVRFWPLNRVGGLDPQPSYGPQQSK
jgi:signal peptidase I